MVTITFNYILPIIGILGGMILIIGTIINMSYMSPWSRISVRIAGLCIVIWGILYVVQISHIFMCNTVASRLLELLRISLGGMAAGIILVVGISGGFSKKSKN